MSWSTSFSLHFHRSKHRHQPMSMTQLKARCLQWCRYALRVSDVTLLRRDVIRGEHLVVQAYKNKSILKLKCYTDVLLALESMPLPKGAQSGLPVSATWVAHFRLHRHSGVIGFLFG